MVPSEKPAALQAAPPPTLGSGELVLVAVMRMAVRSLREAGYTVLEASGGREGLEILMEAGERLRVLITDVVMPDMSGRDLAHRTADIRPGLPIIFMSGYTDEDVIRRGLIERGQRFFQKPVSPDALARAVREAVASEGAARR